MKITGFNGFTFSTMGVTANTDDLAGVGMNRFAPEYPRIGSDPFVPLVTTGAQILTVSFLVQGGTPTAGQIETTLQTVLSRLSYDDPTPKVLTGQLNDGTAVETMAHALAPRKQSVNELVVDFAVTTPGWRASAYTDILAATTRSANAAITNTNTGKRDAWPLLTAYWTGTTQRPTTTATFGWKHRMGTGLTLTNIGTDTIRNMPYQIGPIAHAAEVTAGRGLANGNDFRVFCEGKELRRNLIGANTSFMLVWVVLPEIQPGQTITLELLTNNPSAGAPPTLTYTSDPPLPAMDISGTSFNPSAATSTVITIAGSPWENSDQWVDGMVVVSDGTGAGQMRRVQLSDPSTLTVDEAFTTTPTTGSTIVLWKSGMLVKGRIATSGTTTVLTDTSSSFTEDLIGGQLHVTAGSASGERRTITAVTATTITVSPAFSVALSATSVYRVYKANGYQMWDTRSEIGDKQTTLHKGLWFANTSMAPPTKVHWDAPGSWFRFVYHRNEDEFSQPRYVSLLVGAGDYDHYTIPYIQRARKGKVGTQKERGVADAVGYFTPFPIRHVDIVWLFRNAKKNGVAEGMCEAILAVQESGAETWSTVFSDKAEYPSSVSTGYVGSLAQYGTPNRICVALIPNGGDAIPAEDNNTALIHTEWRAWVLAVDPQLVLTASADFIASPPAAVAVFDMWLRFNTRGTSPAMPYNRLDIGGDGRRVFLASSSERMVVDCEKRTARLTDAAGAFLRRMDYAVKAEEVASDVFGGIITMVDNKWLPIMPQDTTVTTDDLNLTDPSGAGWG
jgi:hypothetical protein